jgi:predicted kinase
VQASDTTEPLHGAESEEPGELIPAPAGHPSPSSGRHKQPKGTVVLTIGLPGSGKTSWFRRRGITPLSSDLLRMMLFDDIAEQRYQDLVFSTLRYLLRARMIARMPWNYVDATNLSPRERRGWIKMAQEFGYEVHAVFFDVPVDVCVDRNQRRGRLVPEDVMQRMSQKLRPPTFDEGFTKITVVRVKKATKTEPEPENEVQQVSGEEPDEQF